MITAQIASLPERVDSLHNTVNSLLPQVDKLFVALNGYTKVPDFLLENEKIEYVILDNSLGDAAKFYDIEKREGYIFTCDDDLVYPKKYVEYMISKIKLHRSPVSLLGKIYDKTPIASFKVDYTTLYRCLGTVHKDRQVDVGGTGAMAFHTDDIKVRLSDFPVKNMADIWMAKVAKEQDVSIWVVEHSRNYVKYTSFPYRIWVDTKDDSIQTEILNSIL